MTVPSGVSKSSNAVIFTWPLSDSTDLVISLSVGEDRDGHPWLHKFKVKKKALTSFSGYFEASLRFNNKYGHEVELKDDDPSALLVWLFYMHAASDGAATTQDAGDPATANGPAIEFTQSDTALFNHLWVSGTDITRLWHIINIGDKYLFNSKLLARFFKEWYEKNVDFDRMTDDFARQLALPCYMFDHAKGFARTTKWLAYNFAGHITEKRPPGFKWQHQHLCPPDFVGPMNHARGGLKTRLHGGLWDRVGYLLESHCDCEGWDSVAGKYFSELVRLQAYPLEKVFPKTSINDILVRLNGFSLENIGRFGCKCKIDWADEVERAVERTYGNFDGLCMDCMDLSRVKRGSQDEDYWKHLQSVNGRWDTHCRVTHGQQTWYVSWCGRDEHRKKLMDLHREKNPMRYGLRSTDRS